MGCNAADAVRSARPKGKECRHKGKEVHGKRVKCYAEGKINLLADIMENKYWCRHNL